MTKIGNFIKEQRKNKKMNITKLSRSSGMSPTAISRIESGERKSPSVTSLYQLAKGLGIDIHDMIDVMLEDIEEEIQ